MSTVITMAILFGIPDFVAACGPLDPNIYYWIKNDVWGNYLENDGTTNRLKQNNLDMHTESQQFQVVESGVAGYHKIHHRASGKTISTAPNAVIISDDEPENLQKLLDVGGGWCNIALKQSGLKLLQGNSGGTPSQSMNPDSANRRWKFIPVYVGCNELVPNVHYKLWNRETKRYITVDGTNAGEDIRTADLEELNQGQQWHMEVSDPGYWNIISRMSTLAVDLHAGNNGENARVQLWKDNGMSAQKWSFTDTSNGYCSIRPKNVDKYLEDQDPNVRTRSREVARAQQEWKILPVADYCTTHVSISPAGEISDTQDIYGKGHKVKANCTDPSYNTTGTPSSSTCSTHETWTAAILHCEETPVIDPDCIKFKIVLGKVMNNPTAEFHGSAKDLTECGNLCRYNAGCVAIEFHIGGGAKKCKISISPTEDANVFSDVNDSSRVVYEID